MRLAGILSGALLVGLLFGSTGCASFGAKMKRWVGGNPDTADNGPVKFSEKPTVNPGAGNNYRRMTSDRMREESQLGENVGSLWVMEGQGSYLFAQNTSRLVGDILNVRIDGYPKEQIVAKTKVIKGLLDQLSKEDRGLASESQAAQAQAEAPAPSAQPPQQPSAQPKDETAHVEVVTTRITEILKDGSYRVEGDMPFMIGPREYKLLVKGIVRAEDFNESGLSAEKLLDPKFDIVGTRKN
jgi:flagellar L-ring protein precursor FlgH